MNIDDVNISSTVQLQAQNNYLALYGKHIKQIQDIEEEYNKKRSKIGKLTIEDLQEKQNQIDNERESWRNLEETYKEIGLETEKLNNKLLNIKFTAIETQQLERINTLMSEIAELNELVNNGDSDSIALLENKQNLLHSEMQTLRGIKRLFEEEGLAIDETNENLTESVSIFSKLKEKIMDIASEPIVFGAAAAWALKKNLEGALEVTSDMFMKMGIGVENVWNMKDAIISSYFSNLKFGATLKENYETTKEIKKQFGSLPIASEQLVTDAIELQKYYGLSEERSVELLRTFHQISKGSNETVESLKDFTIQFSNLAAVIPSDVMSDIASNSEFIAKYTANGGKDMIKFAINARQLGLEMGDITSSAENLLDIESSIRAELEASVLVGKQINLQRARELMLAGKTDEALAEMVSQAGSLEEFNELNVIQREALAKAMGMSVDKLQTMISNQGNLNKLTGDYNESTNMLAKIMIGIGSTIKKFANKENLAFWVSLAGNLFEVAQGWNIMGKYMKATGKIMLDIITFIPRMLINLGKWIASLIFKTSATTADTAAIDMNTGAIIRNKAAQQGLAKTGGITGFNINPVQILAGAAALVVMAGALFLTGKALQEFSKVSWDEMALAGVTIVGLVAAMAALGAIMSSGIGGIAIVAGVVTLGLMAIALKELGSAMYIAGVGSFKLASGLSELVKINASLLSLSTTFTILSSSISLLVMSLTGIGILNKLAFPKQIQSSTPKVVSTSKKQINSVDEIKNKNIAKKDSEPIIVTNKEDTELLKSLNKNIEILIKVVGKEKNIIMNGKKLGQELAKNIPLPGQA